MVGILLLLAMGSYLPWFGLLHAYLPGFDTFRGVSKFVFQATLFVILLSAMGLDSLLRDGLRKRWPSSRPWAPQPCCRWSSAWRSGSHPCRLPGCGRR